MDENLASLVTTCGPALQQLLPDYLWPLNPFKVEQFGPLTKYTLGQLPDGRWAMLHCLKEPDRGDPHDHPATMESHILVGSFYEQRYWRNKEGQAVPYRTVLRNAGESYVIQADCIHSIFELAAPEVWTLVFCGPVIREWRHYPVRPVKTTAV